MVNTLIALILGILPSFAWLFFFLKEDIHPEPKKLLALTFLTGLVAALIALYAEYGLKEVIGIFKIESYNIFILLITAAIEEVIKFLCVLFLIKDSSYFDEPIDAMIYMITAALGFAAFENLTIAFNLALSPSYNPIFFQIASISIFRFIGATLLHALSSAVIGYWWAMGILRYQAKKFIFNGLIIATLLHTFFNYLILLFKETIVYSVVFLVIIGFFVFLDFDELRRKSL